MLDQGPQRLDVRGGDGLPGLLLCPALQRPGEQGRRQGREPGDVGGLGQVGGQRVEGVGVLTQLPGRAYERLRDARPERRLQGRQDGPAHPHPGVRGIGFIERVERTELAPFIAAERADGAPEFAVRQLGEPSHSDLYIVKFVEPMARNEVTIGLDVGSEQRRRDGIEQAMRSGEAALTAAITLVQDDERRPGFLLFVPVYRHGADASTPEQRQLELRGEMSGLNTTAKTFALRGVTVWYGGTVQYQAGTEATLANGKRVEVKGVLSSDRTRLEARRIEFK